MSVEQALLEIQRQINKIESDREISAVEHDDLIDILLIEQIGRMTYSSESDLALGTFTRELIKDVDNKLRRGVEA